jgi:hypothetical protein
VVEKSAQIQLEYIFYNYSDNFIIRLLHRANLTIKAVGLVSYYLSRDLIARCSLSGWLIGAHSYLFPDVLFMYVINNFSSDYSLSHFIYFLFSLSFFIFALRELFRRLELSKISLYHYALFFSLMLNSWFGTFVVPPGTHSSALILTLYIAACISGGGPYISRTLWATIVFISISDKICLTYFVLPLFLLSIFLKKYVEAIFLALILVSGLLLTDKLNSFLGFSVLDISGGNVYKSAKAFLQVNLNVFFLKKPYEGFLIVTGNLFLFYKTFFEFIFYRKVNKNISFWFMTLSSFSTITSVIFLGYFQDESSVRYYLPFIYFGHIGFLCFLSEFKWGRKALYALVLILVFFISRKIIFTKNTSILPSQIEKINYEKYCINKKLRERGLSIGVAEYWFNKKLFVDSEFDIIQVNSRMERDSTLVNRNENEGEVDKAEFIILNNIDPSKVDNILKDKTSGNMIKCGGVKALIL